MEIVYSANNGIEGSNPSLSAMHHVGCMAALKPYMVQGATLWTDMYYVYVLRSEFDGKLYIGYTTNLGNRIQAHNNGEVTSTKSRRPLELIFYEGYKNMEDAKRRERYLKTAKGKSSLNLMLRHSLMPSTM